MFSKLLSLLGIAPNNLEQARGAYTEAKTFAESVNALFAAAGLQLETMLAAGPDSLKAHLAGVDNSAEVAKLIDENKQLKADLATTKSALDTANKLVTAHNEIFATVGFKSDETDAAKFKASHEDFVSKKVTLALAKTGHPPAHVPAATNPIDDVTPQKDDADKVALASLTEYEALIATANATPSAAALQAKADYFAKNHAAIYRGLALRRRN